MRFAHIADCHIGGWREQKLKDLTIKAFDFSLEMCIEKKVDFVLISGDIFNTSLPPIEAIKSTVQSLKKLKAREIPVYIIAGSHDFSPSGKTMLDVLEEADLLINVVKGTIKEDKLKLIPTIDKKTGAKIFGLLGRKGSLELNHYEILFREELEKEEGFKIFMFHSAITEYKPKIFQDMESLPLSLLPKGFDYYAGGHVHYVFKKQEKDYGLLSFPGPLFPNNFDELEELSHGGFYIYENSEINYQPVKVIDTLSLKIDCNHKTPSEINKELIDLSKKDVQNKIVTLRFKGVLYSGKISDIQFRELFDKLHENGAYFIMKNTSKLSSGEFQEIKVKAGTIDEIEDNMINEHLGQIKLENMNKEDEKKMIRNLMTFLKEEKKDGENKNDYELRLKEGLKNIIRY